MKKSVINKLWKVLDIVSALTTLVAMAGVTRYNSFWAIYVVANIMFVSLMYHNKCWGWFGAGLLFIGIGLANYLGV